MLTGRNTSPEWQVWPGTLCVAACGAFEQHGSHLPLETDNLMADYFARLVAEAFDAALLPTLPFGTSLEHSGFRGTITLRPETLMQIMRDLADELERQGFTTLILINSHGGNHCLTPVLRDINRLDRRIKILLVPYWEFADPALSADHRSRGADFHAGEFETSLLMALAPEAVRPHMEDMPSTLAEEFPLKQPDLTTFGVGCFADHGALGWPSLASAEKGRRILESIRTNLCAHIRDRLRRLDARRRFSGTGGLALRPMTAGDIPQGMRLKAAAGWNQLEADWQTLLKANPAGGIVAVHNGSVVGTLTVIKYGGRLAWIGMVLVDPAFRGLGIATRLLTRAVESLADCGCVKLDATPAGKRIYDHLGFVEESRLERMTVAALPALSPDDQEDLSPILAGDLDAIAAYDATVFGADRRTVLESLLALAPAAAWKKTRGGRIVAACVGRPGAKFHQVGPVVATGAAEAQAVVTAALGALRGRAVVLDVPDGQVAFKGWLRTLGFVAERPFIRMVLGTDPAPRGDGQMFAIAGPELG